MSQIFIPNTKWIQQEGRHLYPYPILSHLPLVGLKDQVSEVSDEIRLLERWTESGQEDKMLVFGSFGWMIGADWRTLMKSVSSRPIRLRMDKLDAAGVFQQILDDGFRLAKESVLTLSWPDVWIRLWNSCCLWRFIHYLADGWEVPNFWWDSLFGGGGWEFVSIYGARLMLYTVQCIVHNAYMEPDWLWERGIRSSYQSALHVCLDSYYRTSY